MSKEARLAVGVIFNVVLVLAAVAIMFFAGRWAYNFGNDIFNEQSVDSVENAREVTVVIPDGASNKQVAGIICRSGLAKDETTFLFQIVLSDYRKTIKGGTYTLNTGMKPTEILQSISNDATKENK